MSTEITVSTKIIHDLQKLHQQRATGELVITSNQSASQWQLYFYLGRLVFATGGIHPVRQWHRAFRHHCPNTYKSGWLTKVKPTSKLWQADILTQAIQQEQITTVQAKAVVQSIIQEVVFGFVEQKTLEIRWQPSQPIAQQTAFLSVDQIIQEAQKLRQEWRSAGLGHLQEFVPQFSPDLAPIIKDPALLAAKTSPTVNANLTKLMQGKRTLWDVALKMNQPLYTVIRSLLPLIRQGIIELKEIPDLPFPYPAIEQRKFSCSPKKKGLIACIDDSPIIGQTVKQILQPLGYEVLSITNPLEGFVTLLDNKPDLIFLDLIMPHTNGYELCTFLRKTSVFQNTPIIILTGQDTMIDRVRARMVGASEFLAKPPEKTKLLHIVQKYLEVNKTKPANIPINASFLSSPA
ncbi:response regulator [Aerosakkonemataceae cyanobacterium BLCC-F154]|uniref:Protein PatA n=1 Tax=Floridaenema fluviatile BLCC-F154 TaxID=3153640 RepID=A0ABV4YNL7_9CYAN